MSCFHDYGPGLALSLLDYLEKFAKKLWKKRNIMN